MTPWNLSENFSDPIQNIHWFDIIINVKNYVTSHWQKNSIDILHEGFSGLKHPLFLIQWNPKQRWRKRQPSCFWSCFSAWLGRGPRTSRRSRDRLTNQKHPQNTDTGPADSPDPKVKLSQKDVQGRWSRTEMERGSVTKVTPSWMLWTILLWLVLWCSWTDCLICYSE